MTDAFTDWLCAWGEWLDELLASGITCPGQTTRQKIIKWCDTAEDLGYPSQAAAARSLIDGESGEIHAKHFYHLVVQQDLLQRILDAEKLLASLDSTDTK